LRPVKLDVTVPEQITAAFAAAKERFGRVDVVVNNAGYGLVGEIEGTPDKEARDQFEVNFWAVVNVTKEATKFFREVNPKGAGGRLINISTCGGYSANQCLPFYSASKFALEGFTEAWVKEMLPEWNITGVIIEPGGFDTEWRKGSMITLPSHPAYAHPDTPSSQVRKILDTVPFIGSAKRIGEAILKISAEPNLPLRLQLGSESLGLVKSKALKTVQDADKWEAVSHSTNLDGVDGVGYMQQIMAVNQ